MFSPHFIRMGDGVVLWCVGEPRGLEHFACRARSWRTRAKDYNDKLTIPEQLAFVPERARLHSWTGNHSRAAELVASPLPTPVHTFRTAPLSQFRRRCLTAKASGLYADRDRAAIAAARLLRSLPSRRVRVVSSCTQHRVAANPARDLRAQRSHVAGHRAPIHVSKRPHVPAFTRECACQMRTGGSS
jgi:hypothetical protein